MTMNFYGKAKKIEDLDITRVARQIGVGEDEIHAVIEVETTGGGFDYQGRPKMLFEPHVFYRNLGPKEREHAVAQGLAWPRWRPGTYPKDSYPRLVAAIRIDEDAALKACSWGLGQVLGENHKAAGYATVQEMVEDCLDDEDNHLEMMIRFIKNKKLDDDLRRHDWHGFARGYNGAQYAKHNYHGRLARAFAKWARIPDTKWREEANVEDQEAAREMPPHGKETAQIERVQQDLKDLGYPEVGMIDGKWGGKTAGAIAAFKNDRGLQGPPIIDQVLTDEMKEAMTELKTGEWKRPIAPERSEATEEKVEKEAPELTPVKQSKWTAIWTAVTSLFVAALNAIAEYFHDGLRWVNELKAFAADFPTWIWFVAAAAIAGIIAYASSRGAKGIVDAFRKGERV